MEEAIARVLSLPAGTRHEAINLVDGRIVLVVRMPVNGNGTEDVATAARHQRTRWSSSRNRRATISVPPHKRAGRDGFLALDLAGDLDRLLREGNPPV